MGLKISTGGREPEEGWRHLTLGTPGPRRKRLLQPCAGPAPDLGRDVGVACCTPAAEQVAKCTVVILVFHMSVT